MAVYTKIKLTKLKSKLVINQGKSMLRRIFRFNWIY